MKKILSFGLALLAVGCVLLPGNAHALTANYNDIIDDTVFDNYSSMTASQIDTFLNSFPSSCISTNNGFTAPDPTGYNPTQGFLFGGNVSAGTIIYHAAQAYGINPQVLLATLEKEQSLVTGGAGCYPNNPDPSWPFSSTPAPGKTFTCTVNGGSTACTYACTYSGGCINIALGYNCPGYCKAADEGFSRQLITASWLLAFDRHRSEGQNNWYINKPKWDNSDDLGFCYSGYDTQGGPYYLCPDQASHASDPYVSHSGQYVINSTVVTMTNGPTAALFDYTPFLHGQDLFATYFTNWFGSLTYNVHYRDGHLVTTKGGGIYDIDNGTKRPFPDATTLASYGYIYSDAVVITTNELNMIPDGTPMPYNVHYRDGHLITSTGVGIYDIDNGTKRPFPDETTLSSYSLKVSNALSISNAELNMIPDGTPMPYNVHYRDGQVVALTGGGVYAVVNGSKQPFPDAMTFLSYFHKWSDIVTVTSAELSMIPDGTPMLYNVHYRDGHLVTTKGGGIYDIDNGTKRPFPDETTFFSYGYKYSDAMAITSTELSMIPDGVAMPPKT